MSEESHVEKAFDAAREGRVDAFEAQFREDPELLNIVDNSFDSPLQIALENKRIELANWMLEHGANVFIINHSDRWAMRLMVRRNGLPAADRNRLVETAIAARVWDAEIFHAVWRRDHRAVAAILQSDPSQASIQLASDDGGDGFYNARPYCGLSPLHYAVMAGDLRTVRVLLEGGAEPDAIPHGQDADSRFTPMMFVPSGCERIAQLLIDHGADVRHTAWYLTTGSKAMRRVVIENGAAGTPLLKALLLRQFEKAADIVRNDPSAIRDRVQDAYVDTPLHIAAKAGATDVMELLLDQGMDVDTLSSDGYTTLTMASELYCPFRVFKLLVDRGADIHVDDEAPLRYAIWQHAYGYYDYEDVIRLLIKKGGRPRGLYHCARAGNLSGAKLLIELGVDVNDVADGDWPGQGKGYTALDYCTGVVGDVTYPKLADYLRKKGGRHASELAQG